MNTVVHTINAAGQAFVDFALPMLIQSGVLILILLLVDLVLRRRVRAVFRYWIWMLVLLKLVLPPSLGSPVSIGTWLGETLEVPAVAIQERAIPRNETPATAWPPQAQLADGALLGSPLAKDFALDAATRVDPAGREEVQTPQVPAAIETDSAAATPTSPAPTLRWQALVLLAWAGIVLALLLLLLQRAFFVRGLVAQAQDAPPKLAAALDGCRANMGLGRPVALRVSSNATSPAVCGLLRPVILIPKNLAPKLQPCDLQAVLLHEVAHVKRGDLWVNLIQTLLQIVYFYNPLLWIANLMIRRVREQAVDEAVLVAMGDTARDYPETLINVAKLAFTKRPALSLRLIGVVESKSALTGRIKHILNRPLPKTAKLGAVGLAGVFVVAAFLLPMAKAERYPKQISSIDEHLNASDKSGSLTIRSLRMTPTDGKRMLRMNEATLSVIVENTSDTEAYLGFEYYAESGTIARVFSPGASSRAQVSAVPANWQGTLKYPIHYPRFTANGYIRILLAKCEDTKVKKFISPEAEVLHDKKYPVFTDEDSQPAESGGEPSACVTILPNGITVELVGVCQHPSTGKPWWHPNGTLLEEAPYDKIGGNVYPDASQTAYEFAVRVHNLPNGAAVTMKTEPGGSRSTGSGLSGWRWLATALPDELQKCQLLVGVAAGPWKTLARSRGQSQSTSGTQLGGVMFSQASADPSGEVWITVTDDIIERPCRVVAVTKDGRTINASPMKIGTSGKARQTTAQFNDISLSEIAEFQFQTRPWTWSHFANVSLRPGYKTNIAVRIEPNGGRSEEDEATGSGTPGISDSRRVYLPDLETPDTNVVLDLATGQLLSGEPMARDRHHFTKLGKGDIAYEYAQNKSGLLCLRGARMQRRTETGAEPLTPDVTRESFVVYFLEDAPAQYQISTAEGQEYQLNVISIDRGDRGGVLVEFRKADVAPEAYSQQDARIALPDVDHEAVMLDLASGKLVALPGAESPAEIWQAIKEVGRGDLVYDTRSLILVRDATTDAGVSTVTESFKTYTIGQRLPEVLIVTTAEGQQYGITILAADEKSCTLTSSPIRVDKGAGGGAPVPPSRPEFPAQEPEPAPPSSALSRQVDSATVLDRLGKSLAIYANDHDGAYPETLANLNIQRMKAPQKQWLLANVAYLGRGKTVHDSPDLVLAYDKTLLAEGAGTNVLGNSYRVAFKTPDELALLGIWQMIGAPIPPDANDARALAPGIRLDGIGSAPDHRVFISIVRSTAETAARQYRFVLATKAGQTLEPIYYGKLEQADGKLWEKYSFDMGYRHRKIESFRLQWRPAVAGQNAVAPAVRDEILAAAADGQGSPVSQQAPPGRYALAFDGEGDCLFIPDSESLRAPDQVTIEMWLKPRFPPGPYDNRSGWALLAKGAYLGTGRVGLRGFGISMSRFDDRPDSVLFDHHSATEDGLAGAGTLWKLPADWMRISETFNRHALIPAPGHPLVFGRFLIPTENPFLGQIAEIRIWDGAIADRYAIAQYENTALTGSEPGLLACWTFEEGQGPVARDITPNANHARLGSSIEADTADPTWINLRAGQNVPGEISGRVLDPDGMPVPGAQVALCTKDKGVVIRDGRLDVNRMGGGGTTLVETDSQGRFTFPDEPEAFHIVAAHEKGFAWITDEELVSQPEVRLQSWGRIDGVLYIGRKRGAEKRMGLLNYINRNAIDQRIRYEYEAYTDPNGRFTFDKVPPDWVEVGYMIQTGGPSFPTHTFTARTPVQVLPGQTARIPIGGRGRPVVGKFIPQAGYDGPVYFGGGLRALYTVRPERPTPDNYEQMTKREQQQWLRQWRETDEAQAYYDTVWHDPQRRHHSFRIQEDGTFRIEDVIPGQYTLNVWLEERLGDQAPPEEIGNYHGAVEVPEMAEAYSAEPLDLGELVVEMRTPLHVGDAAPLFEAKTLDGNDIRLIDYRGKFVLLSFWQPQSHPELNRLKELYATYGASGKLQIVGLGGSDTLDEVKNYVAEHKIEWPQIYFGQQWDQGIAKQYGLAGLPYILLIDPDGKIVATWLRGEKLTSTVRQALGEAD